MALRSASANEGYMQASRTVLRLNEKLSAKSSALLDEQGHVFWTAWPGRRRLHAVKDLAFRNPSDSAWLPSKAWSAGSLKLGVRQWRRTWSSLLDVLRHLEPCSS